ncbi:MAG: 16S rRNA (uracil(1498)-N(3))-methyltransferase [Candidatus Aminicenantes bacterium]|nr:MAG: 16S rRNA (uracil(1498)-N(3))-methyltransferase [Candidatus Aminicenantes bacterium]
MTSNRFYIKQTKPLSATVLLYGDEHHHLSKVARIKPKEKVWLFDDHGTNYLARVEEIEKDRTRLSFLEEKGKEEAKTTITLAQALIKSKKMDFILQKATELGITTFIPVITARSIVKIEKKIEPKLERWQKICQEATKQCGRSIIPSILPPQHLGKLVEERNEERKLFLSEKRGNYLKHILLQDSGLPQKDKQPHSVIVLTGPEGGWTAEEESLILEHNYEAVSLGKYILKSETAAISSLAMISHFWNS